MTLCGNNACNKINSGIDECIKPLIEALNNAGLKTIASCCGHGNTLGTIVLADGREVLIMPDHESARKVVKLFPDIHGNEQRRNV